MNKYYTNKTISCEYKTIFNSIQIYNIIDWSWKNNNNDTYVY